MNDVPQDGKTLGEIVARGNVVMKGYLKDAAATEAAFAGGWFHTGDLAVRHPDGYVQLRDRSKDIIISGGENISSIEVEDALFQHPAVMDAAVIGLPHRTLGEEPAAVVTLKPGHEASEADIRAFVASRIAAFKVPVRVALTPEPLPRGRHKLDRDAVRASQRERLLRAMLQCVAADGYAATTVPRVAAAARWCVAVRVQRAHARPAGVCGRGMCKRAEQPGAGAGVHELLGACPVTVQDESVVEGGDERVLELHAGAAEDVCDGREEAPLAEVLEHLAEYLDLAVFLVFELNLFDIDLVDDAGE